MTNTKKKNKGAALQNKIVGLQKGHIFGYRNVYTEFAST